LTYCLNNVEKNIDWHWEGREEIQHTQEKDHTNGYKHRILGLTCASDSLAFALFGRRGRKGGHKERGSKEKKGG